MDIRRIFGRKHRSKIMGVIPNIAATFMRDTVLIANDLLDDPKHQWLLAAYTAGVVDYLGQQGGLDQTETSAVMAEYLKSNLRIRPENIPETMHLIASIHDDELGRRYMKEGGTAMLRYLTKQDVSTVFQLRRLLESEPGPLAGESR